MGQVVNFGSLLLGVMAFASWTYLRLRETRGRGLANALGGIGILALVFSTVSPDDDWFQKELIRPATQSVNVPGCLRAAPRRQPVAFSTDALVVAVDPVRVSRAGNSVVTDQHLHLERQVATSVLIHSPPGSFATGS